MIQTHQKQKVLSNDNALLEVFLHVFAYFSYWLRSPPSD